MSVMTNLKIIQGFAEIYHETRGEVYGGLPYGVHLEKVLSTAIRFNKYVSIESLNDVYAACLCHDLMEAGMKYSDLVKFFGYEVADIVFDVTDELGKNRVERALRTYPKIAKNELAKFVKLCDRIANMQSSIDDPGKAKMYVDQYPVFEYSLKVSQQFEELWAELDALYTKLKETVSKSTAR